MHQGPYEVGYIRVSATACPCPQAYLAAACIPPRNALLVLACWSYQGPSYAHL